MVGVHGREVLVVTTDKMSAGISVLDVECGEQLLHIPTCASPPHGLVCLGNQILVASQVHKHQSYGGGAIFFWKLNKSQTQHRSYPIEAIGPICGTKDGSYLVGGAPSGNLYTWEISSGRLLKCWHAHQKPVTCLIFSSDGSFLISGSDDGAICVWSMIRVLDVADPQASGSLPSFHSWSNHSSSISGLLPVSFGSSSILISSSFDCTCKVWDLVLGRLKRNYVFSQALTAIAVDLGEQFLFVGGADGRIFVNALDVGLPEYPSIFAEDKSGVLCGHKGAITALSCSMNRLWLISASEDFNICVWDVFSLQIIQKFGHLRGHITNLLVVPHSALSGAEKLRNCLRPHISLLDKSPQLAKASEGTITHLPIYNSLGDLPTSTSFKSSTTLNQHVLDLEQGRTAEAIRLKVETTVENRLWAMATAKHVTAMNKHLQSRLLDMMHCRLVPAKRKKPEASGIEDRTQSST